MPRSDWAVKIHAKISERTWPPPVRKKEKESWTNTKSKLCVFPSLLVVVLLIRSVCPPILILFTGESATFRGRRMSKRQTVTSTNCCDRAANPSGSSGPNSNRRTDNDDVSSSPFDPKTITSTQLRVGGGRINNSSNNNDKEDDTSLCDWAPVFPLH